MIPKEMIEKILKKQGKNKTINIIPVTDTDHDGNVYLLGFRKEVTTKKVVYFESCEIQKFSNYDGLKKHLDELEKTARVVI